MAISVRSEATGRARANYDDLELYDIVREVALTAVAQIAADGGNLDPLLITEKVWDGARPASIYPDAPSARQICQRLRDYKKNPFPWRKLVEIVFDPDADIAQVEVARTRSPALRGLNPDETFYALKRLARREGTITIDTYAHRRSEEIANNPLLETCLPTVGQILFLHGSWPDALRHAGLEVRTEHYTAGRVSVRESALRFYSELGVLPTPRLLRFFAKNQGFAMEDVTHDPRWALQLVELRSFIVESGLTEPPEYVPAETQARWAEWIEAKAAAAAGAEPGPALEANTGDADEQDAKSAPLAYLSRRRWPLKSEILEQLQKFLAWELPAGHRKRNTNTYKLWAQEATGRPSLDSVQKFAALDKLLKEARRPDAVEKAKEQEASKAPLASAEREARLHEKHVQSKRGQQMLGLLRERGELTRAELETELGWPQRTVNGYLGWLIDAGAVEKLGDTNRTARYRTR